MNAKEMFEKLGYCEKITNYCIFHQKGNKEINIWLKDKEVECIDYVNEDDCYLPCDITLEELQAINKQIEELGWNRDE